MEEFKQLLFIKQRKEGSLEQTIQRLEKQIHTVIAKSKNTEKERTQLRVDWHEQNQKTQVFDRKELLIQKEKLNQYHQQDISLDNKLKKLDTERHQYQTQQIDFKKQLLKNRRSQEKLKYLFNELMENK